MSQNHSFQTVCTADLDTVCGGAEEGAQPVISPNTPPEMMGGQANSAGWAEAKKRYNETPGGTWDKLKAGAVGFVEGSGQGFVNGTPRR
jgi:hypothetical protein